MSSQQNVTPVKPLGFWRTTSLVTGNMIGSGVYLLPASLAIFGGISLFGWLISACGAIILALLFARLSNLHPKAGGPYAFVHEVFGDFMGFEIAWTYWISVWIGNAAISIALVSYLSYFFPILKESNMMGFLVTFGMLWLFTAINAIGVKQAGIVQLVTSILKLIPLILLGFVGIFYIDFNNFVPFNPTDLPDFSAIMMAGALTLWSFIGVEAATIPAEHVQNPKKIIPLATLTGTFIAAIVYILSTSAVLGILGSTTLLHSHAPFVDAAEKIWGHYAAVIVAVSAVISSMGALNGWILIQGEVPKAAAADKLFPAIFGKVTKAKVPIFGLMISSLLISLLLVMNFSESLKDQFKFLVLLATLNMLLPYIFSSMAALYLFVKKKKEFSKTSFISYLTIAVLGFAYSFWAIIGAGQTSVFWGFMVILLGIPVYVILKIIQNK
ncbi:MAG: amino acid permease [Alphaproteobacteria bacterium]|nr:amino acid permease [Alphaproteobacteria bacterium]